MYERRRLVIRTWSRFFMSTSGSMEARSDGWYISCMDQILQGAQGPRRPRPVDVVGSTRDGATAPGLGRAEDEQTVGLGRSARFGAPQFRHLADRRDVVERDTGQAVPLGLGGCFPDPLRKADAAADPSPAVRLDVADDEH